LKIAVKVKAGSSREKVERIDGANYAVWVRAKPTDGKANEAVIKALSKHFDTAKSNITLVTGHASKQKIFSIAI
jgi:hypothetical protein